MFIALCQGLLSANGYARRMAHRLGEARKMLLADAVVFVCHCRRLYSCLENYEQMDIYPNIFIHFNRIARLSQPIKAVPCEACQTRLVQPLLPANVIYAEISPYSSQSSITLPQSPDSMTSNPFWKSSMWKWCVMTGERSRPEISICCILYHVSHICLP